MKTMSLEDKIKINREQLQELTDYRNKAIVRVFSFFFLLPALLAIVFILEESGIYRINTVYLALSLVASFAAILLYIGIKCLIYPTSILAFFKVSDLIREHKMVIKNAEEYLNKKRSSSDNLEGTVSYGQL